MDENVKVFSNDRIPGLYEKVAIGLAACVWREKMTGDAIQAMKGHLIQGKPLLDCLKEQKDTEIALVTLLFSRLMNMDDFVFKLRRILPTADYFNTFLEAIKDVNDQMLMMVRSLLIL